ncbi:hypothetical protein PoMZ_11826 [Pyricularia oryzae]|uniref:Uncharacterized protein n=1 Tax=Pyricularia oryzae TaxID=318829 RepID=A0A4P7NLI1_PYROR|nr:hypothetical protein PoMZ_11826 [Pyricularia oryzae]
MDVRYQLAPLAAARIDAVEISLVVMLPALARGQNVGDLEDQLGHILGGRPLDVVHGAQAPGKRAEGERAGHDGRQPLLPVPGALVAPRAGDLAHAHHGRRHAAALPGLVEDQRADQLGAPVAGRGQRQVVGAALRERLGSGPPVGRADGADKDDVDVLGGLEGEVDKVARRRHVRLKGLDRHVEVDGPGVVHDAVRVAEQSVVRLGVEPQVRSGQVRVVELDLGERGRQPALGAELLLPRAAVVAPHVEDVGPQRARGAREDDGLVGLGRRGLVLLRGRVAAQTPRVLFKLRLHGLDAGGRAAVVVVVAVCVAVLLPVDYRVEDVSGQLLGGRVGVDEAWREDRGRRPGQAGGLEAAADHAHGVEDLQGVDAGGEKVPVERELLALVVHLAELLKQFPDGLGQLGLGGDVDGDGRVGGAVGLHAGLFVQGVRLELVELDGGGALHRALAGAGEGLVRARHQDQLLGDAAVGDGDAVGLLDERPDALDEAVGLLVVLGRELGQRGLDDQRGLEPACADDHGGLEVRVAGDGGLDGDGVELLAVGEDDDVVGAAVVLPVVGQRRVLDVQVLGRVLVQVGEGVEDALGSGRVVLLLALDDVLVHLTLVGQVAVGNPLVAHPLRVDDEPLPELGVPLHVVGQRGGLGVADHVEQPDALAHREAVAGLGVQGPAAKEDVVEPPQGVDGLGDVGDLVQDGGREDGHVDVDVGQGVHDGLRRHGPRGDAERDGHGKVDGPQEADVQAGGVEQRHRVQDAPAGHARAEDCGAAHELGRRVEGIRHGQHAHAHKHGLREPGAAAGVHHHEGVPLGLLKRLCVGYVRRLAALVCAPAVDPLLRRVHPDAHHGRALVQPQPDLVVVLWVVVDGVAVGLVKEVQLRRLGVPRRDEERLHAGLDAGHGEDDVARVAGAEVRQRRELVLRPRVAAPVGLAVAAAAAARAPRQYVLLLLQQVAGHAVDGARHLPVAQRLPAVLGVVGAWHREHLPVRCGPGQVVQDLWD